MSREVGRQIEWKPPVVDHVGYWALEFGDFRTVSLPSSIRLTVIGL